MGTVHRKLGVAGSSLYTAIDTDGSIMWQTGIQDGTSSITGSSVFDFDSDGRAEVVYSDETRLWVFSGLSGEVKLELPLSSATWIEYPVVADVDADGSAEIVVVANDNNGSFGNDRGIRVYGPASGTWNATRGVWNQHAYSVTNVNSDATIPTNPLNNWQVLGLNNFRLNEFAPNDAPPECGCSEEEVAFKQSYTGAELAQLGLLTQRPVSVDGDLLLIGQGPDGFDPLVEIPLVAPGVLDADASVSMTITINETPPPDANSDHDIVIGLTEANGGQGVGGVRLDNSGGRSAVVRRVNQSTSEFPYLDFSPRVTGVGFQSEFTTDIALDNQVATLVATQGGVSGTFVFDGDQFADVRLDPSKGLSAFVQLDHAFESYAIESLAVRLVVHSTNACPRNPDLSVSPLTLDELTCPTVNVSSRVGNAGFSPIDRGAEVALMLDGSLVLTHTVSNPLAPGEFEEVSLLTDAPGTGIRRFDVIADPNGLLEESNESNNLASVEAAVCRIDCAQDLAVRVKRDKVQLTWTNSLDAAYEILRSTSLDGPYTKIADTASTYSTYLDDSPPANARSYYKVRRTPGDEGDAFCESDPVAAFVPGGRSRIRLVPVPDLIGSTDGAASTAITGAGLTVGAATSASTTTAADGAVFQQDPPGGQLGSESYECGLCNGRESCAREHSAVTVGTHRRHCR